MSYLKSEKKQKYNCFHRVMCNGVTGDAYQKLSYLADITGHPLADIATLCMEEGIENYWRRYKKNPKYKEYWEEMEGM